MKQSMENLKNENLNFQWRNVTTIKGLFFHRILMFGLIVLLPNPEMRQRSRNKQVYKKERKLNIAISLTFNIIKSHGYTFTNLLNSIDILLIFPLIIYPGLGKILLKAQSCTR